MARHLGGAAEAEYDAAVAAIGATRSAGATVRGGYDDVKVEAEPKLAALHPAPCTAAVARL